MKQRRVVVTGMGAFTPIGKSAPDFWNGLKNGESGVRPITHFDVSKFATKFAGQIEKYDPSEHLDRKDYRRMDKFCQYAIIAADEAVEDSKIDLDSIDKDRVSVMIGSGIGGIDTYFDQTHEFDEYGPKGVSPFFIPMLIPDIAAGHVSIRFGFRGANFCTVSACATGSHNIGLAFDSIKMGQSDMVLAGGAESPVIEMGVAGFNAMRALSTRNESPETASRPFDKTRDGFVLGEGSGILVLEELEQAKERGAKIYGEVLGYGFSADGHHITAPDPEGNGVILALNRALESCDVSYDQIDHINMHGTSTPLGDVAETNSIKKVFGDHAYKMNLNSTKSMTGHSLGAAGAIEAIATLLAVHHDIVPPTINYSEKDPRCDLDYTTNEAVSRKVNYAMNNAFGFGGHNTSLVFKKFEA